MSSGHHETEGGFDENLSTSGNDGHDLPEVGEVDGHGGVGREVVADTQQESDIEQDSDAEPFSETGQPLDPPRGESTFLEAVRDRRERRRRTAVIVLVSSLALLMFFGMTSGKTSIENSIRKDASRTLKDSYPGVIVAVDGTNVKLSGSVSRPEEIDEAKALVGNLKLVSSVDAQGLTVRASNGSGLLPMHAVYNEGALTLGGMSPGKTAEGTLLAAAKKGLGDSKVVNQLTESSALTKNADPAAYESLGRAFANFPRLNVRTADLTVSETGLTVTGVLADAASRDQLIAMLKAAVLPLPVKDNFTVETTGGGVTSLGSTIPGATAPSTTGGGRATTTLGTGSTTPGSTTAASGGPLAAADPTTVASTQTELNDLLTNNRIEFATDSDLLTSSAKAVIKRVADLVGPIGVNLEVGGHTDSRGKAERNQALSQRRAEAVRAELITLGIAEKRVNAVGYGSSKLIAPDNTPRGNPKNRRIEILLTPLS